jgi:hypothetical protein
MQINKMTAPLLSCWHLEDGARGIGNASLLAQPLIAFFGSRQCSGAAIRAALDWAVEQARSKTPLIGGFHSPLEKSVLEVMLAANAPIVIVIARRVGNARLPSTWRRAVRLGTAAIVGMEGAQTCLTNELAARRNDWVAKHAARIVLAHVSADGRLARQAGRWEREGHRVSFLAG